jgi:putative DNA primase/helicase
MTCDLRTGDLREPNPEGYITKEVAVAPAEPGTEAPLWRAFLDRITDRDADLQDYLQRVAGYCLTGLTTEHVLFFCYGTGANGKSVFINTLVGIWHDYAVTIGTDMLMASPGDRHPTEIARLRGVRLAVGSEIEAGRSWAESKLKQMTGGDKLQGRFMRQDFFEFTPQFKLLIAGNSKPSLRGVDEAIRRRLHLIPFTVTIPPEERDHHLPEKLKEEWPAILRWAIEGCLLWQQYGLQPPRAVLAATEGYLAGEDSFALWREDCTTVDTHAWERSADLWQSWKRWAESAGEYVGSQKRFSQTLEDHGFVPERQPGTGKRGFRGARLKRHDYTDDPRYGS